ncbi:MAG: VOC family protein [Acidimicrobiales bacterium]|nr:VOC family protein [Acidimicrobiales bacterium]
MLGQTAYVKPLGVHHVSINVDDVSAAVAFYTDALGFRRRNDRPNFGFDGAWLDAGDQQLHLIAGAVPTGVGQHFAVRVADLDAVVAELRDKALSVSDPKAVGSGRQAFVTDPAGNLVELHEVGN